tara:strand:- start:137 stop:1309 length:1173 start_codon:yes stop_codon:yes gene_type:complete
MEEVKSITEEVTQEGDFKIKKKKPKKLTSKKTTTKVDLTNKKQEETKDAISESRTGDVDETQSTTPVSEVVEEVRKVPQEETETKSEQVIEEITDVNPATKEIVEEIKEEIKENPQLELPENVEKLVEFMKETGGTLTDYVRLNADYSQINNETILKEYYIQTKPHLDSEEIDFLMDDNFAWDEDIDEERDIRKKKLALKEEVAKARGFMEDLKSKYYDEIKLRPGVTQEQQKATDFFNRYNKEQEVVEQRHTAFKDSTKKLFSKDFKGFEFNLGDKQFRYGVNNPSEVADTQSNLSDFIKTFLDEEGNVNDYKGYHKAIYAARNADTIANHFYEQGKTDAIKDVTAKSKNISNELRPTSNGEVFINGMKVRAISGVDSSKLKIKTKNKN